MDKYLILGTIMLMSLEAGWLLQDLQVIDIPGLFAQTKSEDGENILGKITLTKHQVKKRASDSLVWEETRPAQELYAYDSVLTLEHSAAEIDLVGNTHLALRENTLITIEPFYQKGAGGPVRLKFRQGVMREKSGRDPQSVETGEWVVEASPEANLTLRTTGADSYEIEAVKGFAKIINSKSLQVAQTVEAGESVGVSGNQVSVPKLALPIEWAYPEDGAKFYTHESQATIDLGWSGEADALLVDKINSAEFHEQHEFKQEEKTYRLVLEQGAYSVKLKSKDQESFARSLSVWPAPKIFLIQPLTRSRFKWHRDIDLLWSKSGDVHSYLWQISSDPDFKSIVASGETTETAHTVSDLSLGHYFWRVLGKDSQGFVIPALYYNKFFILENPLEAPKLKAPKVIPGAWNELFQILKKFYDLLLPSADAAEPIPAHYSATFEWENVEGADSYVIEISEEPDFRNPVVTETTGKTLFQWKDFKLGKYYWRVAGQAGADVGLFSDPAIADLATIPKAPIRQVPVPVARAKPSPTPAPVPPPVIVHKAEPTPTPEQKEYDSPPTKANFVIQGGGVVEYAQYRTADFFAADYGYRLGQFRFEYAPPRETSQWRYMAEYERKYLKIRNPDAFPFQDPIKLDTLRISAIRETSDQGGASFGFALHNQFILYQRNDLENLSGSNPLFFGGFVDWRNLYSSHQTEYQLGTYAGRALALQARISRSWFLGKLLFTTELEANSGLGRDWAWWYDARLNVLFGIRW